jgi:hypothetical protein
MSTASKPATALHPRTNVTAQWRFRVRLLFAPFKERLWLAP